jgi:hypothetical protein
MSESAAERQARINAEQDRQAKIRLALARAKAKQAAEKGDDEPPVLRTGKGLTDGGAEQ